MDTSTDDQGDHAGTDAAPALGPVGTHPRLVAGLFALVSVTLVLAAAGRRLPASAIPRVDPLVTAAPHLNALVIAAATLTVAGGVRAIRRGDVTRHRRLMLASVGLFGVFLVVYCYRVALVGPKPFPGPPGVYRFVYLPVLAVHVLAAILSLPAVYYALTLALTRPVERLPSTPHPRAGRVAAALWLVSFVLGLVVYGLLYVVPW